VNDKHLGPEETAFSCDRQSQQMTMTRKRH